MVSKETTQTATATEENTMDRQAQQQWMIEWYAKQNAAAAKVLMANHLQYSKPGKSRKMNLDNALRRLGNVDARAELAMAIVLNDNTTTVENLRARVNDRMAFRALRGRRH